MIAILSPAKRIAESRRFSGVVATGIRFPVESDKLVQVLKKLSPEKLAVLMQINPQLANLNYNRYQRWCFPFGEDVVHAMAGFDGEVYNGLQATGLSAPDLEFAQRHVRILSGLYGLLRPFDEVMPYRLEMGTPLRVGRSLGLYRFWGGKLAVALEKDLVAQRDQILVNVASEEYSKAVLPYMKAGVRVITPVFKEFKNGKYTQVIVFAKKARGLITRFIIENRLSDPDHLKAFDTAGYLFEPSMSDESRFTFVRKQG